MSINYPATDTAYHSGTGNQQYLVNIGIQQWDEDWEVGTIDNSTGQPDTDANNIRSKNFCACLPNTDYYLEGSVAMRIYWYASDQSFISGDSVNVDGGVVTSPATAAYFKIRTTTSYGSTYLSDISVNFPSNETGYFAWTGRQGVYGGELDVTTGVLTAKYASVDLGTLTWVKGASSFYTALNDILGGTMNLYCENYKAVTISQITSLSVDKAIASNSGSGRVNIRDTSYSDSDAATFKTAMSGVQLVYELATPITIQLDPTAVNTLRGDNVIWADCGDITNCEYRADLKMYIDKVVGA